MKINQVSHVAARSHAGKVGYKGWQHRESDRPPGSLWGRCSDITGPVFDPKTDYMHDGIVFKNNDGLRHGNAGYSISEGAKEYEFGMKEPAPNIAQAPAPYDHYKKDVRHLDMIDVYRVIQLWEVNNAALEHALKKILVAGGRGAKDWDKDVQEAIDSLIRAQQMRAEDKKLEAAK